jgi:catechol 2,3-dioxygenase-like lactoylglutathione lyase family enzyme
MTDLVRGLGYVSLEVPDLETAVDFYRRAIQLTVTERGAKSVFMAGGVDHHWLRLHEGPDKTRYRLGYEVMNNAALGEITQRLDARSIPWTEGGGIARERIDRSIIFRDLDGVELELFTQMVELPVPVPQSTVHMQRILHAVWNGRDPVQAFKFYNEVLGCRDSDWIERFMVFLRCGNRYHHSIGVGRSETPGVLNHFCILVDSIDDVMRARNNALELGVELRMDLCRHAASGSMGVYLQEPFTGIAVEFCTQHGQIDDEDHRARILPASPVTGDVWQERPELVDGDPLRLQGELSLGLAAPPAAQPQSASAGKGN